MNPVGQPQVGDWYQNPDQGRPFQIVSVDAATGTVQTQSFDGEVDSIDEDEWDDMPLVTAAAPEDWSGAFDDVEPDDLSDDDSPSDRMATESTEEPIEPLEAAALDDLEADEDGDDGPATLRAM